MTEQEKTERHYILYHPWAFSRVRMGIITPPFRWSDLLHWWGWRAYVFRWRKWG